MAGQARSGRVAIVGHVEWVTHVRGQFPPCGGIADLVEPLEEPAGGGGVAACAAARLGAPTTLITALGDDVAAGRAHDVLGSRGITVIAARRTAPQTPALSVSEPGGERTILVVGPRLQPRGDEELDWDAIDLDGAAYYAGEDPGSLLRARRARALVVSARRVDDLIRAEVTADVVVGSEEDPAEDASRLPAHLTPTHRIVTRGARGGRIIHADGTEEYFAAAPLDDRVVDSYGCGDTFAAGVTVGLARGLTLMECVRLGAGAGARCALWRGGIGPP